MRIFFPHRGFASLSRRRANLSTEIILSFSGESKLSPNVNLFYECVAKMSSKSNGGMPRRKFITLGLSTVGGLVIGSSICGQPSLAAKTKIVRTKLDPEELKGKYGFKGMVTLPPGTDFSKAAVDR